MTLIGGCAKDKDLDKKVGRLRALMESMEYKLNNVQLAVTLAIQQSLMRHKHANLGQVWSVPAGHGKSRIILALIVGLRIQDPSLEFLVVYNHGELLEEDRERLSRAAKVLGDAKIDYMVASLDAEIPLKSDKQITIIDEVDSVLIDSRCCPVKHYLSGRTRIVGLTATADNEMIKAERQVLKELDLEVYDSKIADNHKESEPLMPLSLEDFFHSSFDHYARLVFVDEDKLATVEAICQRRGLKYLENCSKLSELRALKPKTVCAVTEGRLMRGFDYKSNNR